MRHAPIHVARRPAWIGCRLYPITIRLYQRGLLFQTVSAIDPAADMLHCVEAVNLRSTEIATDPARDIRRLSHTSRTATVASSSARLRAFVIDFMPDGLMQTHPGGRIYKSAAVVPILLAFEQKAIGHEDTAFRNLWNLSNTGWQDISCLKSPASILLSAASKARPTSTNASIELAI